MKLSIKNQIITGASIIAMAATSQALAQSVYGANYGHFGRTVIGGNVSSEPGAASYGAENEAGRRAVVYVDGLFPFEPTLAVEISPWHRIEGFNGDEAIEYPGVGHVSDGADGTYTNAYTRGLDKIADRLEDARQQWLKDNGYVGGVRLFTSTGSTRTAAVGSELPEPRGIIVVPDNVKRQKTRFQVQIDEPRLDGAVENENVAVRISLPPMMRVSTVRVVVPQPKEEPVVPSTELLAAAGS